MVSSRRAGDLVGIGVEETHPAQSVDLRQPFEQQREAVLQAEVFAVAGGVLPDERDFAHALLREALGFGDDRLEAPRAELAAQLRNDAERAGMIAAFGDLDVSRVLRRGQQARRVLVVEIVGQVGDGAVPGVAWRSGRVRGGIAFGTRSAGSLKGLRRALDGVGTSRRRRDRIREVRQRQDLLQLAGADHRVHLGMFFWISSR